MSLRPVFTRVAEVAGPWFTQGRMGIAAVLLLGVLGLAAALLGDFHGVGDLPSLFPQLSAASPTFDASTPSEELALPSVGVHQLGAAGSSRSLDASAAPVPLPPAKNTAMPVSGAWLLRDPPNQKPPIKLLTREEAQQAQRQLIERGYLLGPADGTWSLRSQAALLDFRRAQGFSDEAWTSERQSAPVAQSAAPPELPAERAGGVEQVFPPDRPTDLPDGIAKQEPNDFADEIASVTPAARAPGEAQPIRAGEPYVGAWARSRAACFESEVPPLAISAQRASSFGGRAGECAFEQVRREGNGWRARARCFADGKRWTANVHLRATASTLIWSSERGQATYYRCG